MHQKLWYTSPAYEWLDGLPIGTGRLAAMALGTYKRDRVALNHEWLWKGKHRLRDNENRSERLQHVRELLLRGQYAEGTKAGNDAFAGKGGISGEKHRVDPYQPAGDLYVEFNHGFVWDYRRELDMEKALVTVQYQAECRRFRRQYVAHLKDDVILVRLDADGAPFDCRVWLDRNFDPDCDLTVSIEDDERLVMDGRIHDGIAFRVLGQVWHEGGSQRGMEGRSLVVAGTREVLIAVNIGTSANGNDPAEECRPKTYVLSEWQRLVDDHVGEHASHYGGMRLELPLSEPDLPTDERIARVRRGEHDPGLALLYFNFGRYLLCASSATASLPANLQGKWNEDLYPPWECDYHHDVNLEMNYWMAEPCGMQAYVEALLQHIERFVPHAKKAAHDLYGCRGIWFPIQTDAWGRSTPEAYGWAVWIGAAPWLAQHIWWHYQYGQDVEFLRSRAYPFLKEVAAFYEDYLVEDAAGTLQIVPSQSPENRFRDGGEFPVTLCVSAAMDIELAWDALTHAVRASQILGVDADKRNVWQDMLRRLPPLKIGSKGQLLEWNEEFEEVEPGHRHISHLVGLYPGEQIDPERTPELFAAARRSLELRMAASGGHTGWSRAWVACCYARLGEGDKAFDHVQRLITNFATKTLLDLHPPRIFQIEGNLGGVAAVVEMLLQSYHEELHFLPALPSAWPAGRVSGLRARGGYTVNIQWWNGKLARAEITSLRDRECVVKTGRMAFEVVDTSGKSVASRREEGRLTFPVKAGDTYVILPM